MSRPTTLRFPDHFRWGTATSSFQIEGASTQDGRTDSIWDVFCRVPGAIADGSDGTVAVDHYHRYRADVALMAGLGLQRYRFSVAWPRVVRPDGTVNPAGLDFYSRLTDELLGHGIEPWLTLYHWDLPAWMPGGWLNRDTASRFADYAMVVHEALADRVRIWTTLNEPWCSSFLSFGGGEHAPGHTDPVEALTAGHHLLLGHGLATQALRAADSSATLGITLNFTPVSPADPDNADDRDLIRRMDATAHRFFIDPLFRGSYPEDLLADAAAIWPADLVHEGDLETISTPIDVLGINYYTSQLLTSGTTEPGPTPYITAPDAVLVPREVERTAMGWEVTPDALRELLLRLHRDYTGPAGVRLVITENGAAFDDVAVDGVIDDPRRIRYLDAHLRACHQAIEAGVPLDGYLLWSFIDNFEWAHGYKKLFGIVGVDGELNRIPKASARWYADVISANGLPTPPA